jgi:hypothetical protein
MRSRPRSLFDSWLVMILLLLSLPFSVSAEPLDNWHWRNPVPRARSLGGVTYGNGTWVAVGEFGTVYTSPDGESWTLGTSGDLDDLYAVTWGAGLFVAVGAHGKIITSSDGTVWTVTRPGDGEYFSNITFGNGLFVAVGNNGIVLVSREGVSWKAGRAGKTQFLRGITYAAGRFVATGYYSRDPGTYRSTVFTSYDGLHWQSVPVDTHDPLSGVAYGNGKFVAVGSYGLVLTSEDGLTWTQRQTADLSSFTDVVYGNGLFVAVGTGRNMSSLDGVTWEMAQGASSALQRAGYGGGKFVAIGGDPVKEACPIFWSTDGKSWTGRTQPGIRNDLYAVVYANNTFSAAGAWKTLLQSPDGVTWASKAPEVSLYQIVYGNGVYVARGDQKLFTSLDGEHWVFVESAGTRAFRDVAFGNGFFLATGYEGKDIILVSSDGVHWADKSLETKYRPGWISYGNGLFMVLGNDVVMTTPDGEQWTIGMRMQDPGEWPTAMVFSPDSETANSGFLPMERSGRPKGPRTRSA